MLDAYFEQVNELINDPAINTKRQVYSFDEHCSWPRTDRQVILTMDTAIELGHPQTESLAFLMWTETRKTINQQITIIGPDINEVSADKMSFGKIVLISGHGFTEENAYQRYQEMDAVRFKLNLDGYMLRAIPQEGKEWSRVSKHALKKDFSLKILGNELIRELQSLEYVDAAEIIFITSSPADVERFKPLGGKVTKVCQAMNKMFDNLEYDCSSCSFADVCDEIDGLKTMHQKTRAR